MRLILAAAFLVLLPCSILAGPFDDKTPTYYIDRYGPAKSNKTESSVDFVDPLHGSVKVKGQFSVLDFRDGDLRVHGVFSHPSLKLAAVRLQLNRAWTEEQIQAALAAYGGSWTPFKHPRSMIRTWITADGSRAIVMLTWIDFQSKAVVDLVERTLAEADAQRKAIPKL